MDTLDMTGKVCPLPVIETKKRLTDLGVGDELQVIVDNVTAVENLAKFATQKGHALVKGEQNPGDYHVTITKGDAPAATSEAAPAAAAPGTARRIVVVSSDTMGEGDERLGRTLLSGFLYALAEQDTLPETILFYNGGVRMTTEGSPSLDDLRALEAEGVEIMSCGACLNHYGLTEQLQVGSITNMYVICEKQMAADVIVKP